MQQSAGRGKPITKFGLVLWAAGLFVAASYLLLAAPQKVFAGSDGGKPPIIANGMAGSGTLTDPFQVTTCTNLQNVSLNLLYSYSLANDIDCSDTVNWNNGAGFIPIGYNASNHNSDQFEGTFDGHGHSISDLYINTAGNEAGNPNYIGLFSELYRAHLLHFNLVGVMILANNPNIYYVGGVAGYTYGSDDQLVSITQVSFSGSITSDKPGINIGGLVGYMGRTRISNSSAEGSILTQDATVGGLVGYLSGGNSSGEGIRNSYAAMDITLAHQSGNSATVGGLIGYANTLTISSSYSSGSISISGGTTGNIYSGGLVGNGYNGTLTNNVAQIAITLPVGFSGSIAKGGIGGSLSNTVITTDYYDQVLMDVLQCEGSTNDQSCTAINTSGTPDPTYFDNNATNPPYDQWDFTNIWQTTTGLPTLRTNISGNPTAPTNVVATIASTTSINLSWDAPGSSGSSPITEYVIDYLKEGQTTWLSFDTTSTNTSYVLGSDIFAPLDPAAQYTIRVVAQNKDGYFASSTDTIGHTAIPGFDLISTCQDLQNMQNDLSANYELTHDIDCSDTVNWNQGQGFLPVGLFEEHYPVFFTGVLEGNNYTISNLFTDLTADNNYVHGAGLGLFGFTSGALIQDLRLSNPSFTKLTPNSQGWAGSITGGDLGSTITNVQVTNGNIESLSMTGGLIGLAYNITGRYTHISQSSFAGAIHIYPGGNSHDGAFVGGLVGSIQGFGGGSIENSYARADITSEVPDTMGGLMGILYSIGNTSTVAHSYASGSLTNTSTDSNGEVLLGGLIGETYTDQGAVINLTNSFAYNSMDSSAPQSFSGGIVAGAFNRESNDGFSILPTTTDAFDTDLAGVATCDANPDNPSLDCLPISGNSNYFYNNHTNAPLDSWDFTNIWEPTSTLPVFSNKALATLSSIPAERINPKKPGATVSPSTPVVTPTGPTGKQTFAPGFAGVSPSLPPPADNSIIGKIKQLLNHIPASVLVSFPYVMFGLLFAGAVGVLIEMFHQIHRLKVLNALLAKQRSIAQQRDTFWHLAANYLRAPITLLMGGVELLNVSSPVAKSLGAAVAANAHIAKSPTVTKIAALVTSMQSKVSGIMEQIEHSSSLQGITWPKLRPARSVARSIRFWLPLGLVAGLVVFADYVARGYRHLDVSTVTLASQAAIFLLVVLALYWVLNGLGLVTGKRRQAEELLAKQTAALDSARVNLVNKTADALDSEVDQLEVLLNKLSAKEQALPALHEGASRLRHMVDSFQLLISAQNHKLNALSAHGTTTKIDDILGSVMTSLQPQVDAKQLTLDAPKVTNLVVPGSAKLIDQVISSVLDNAIAFSPSNGTVTIDLTPQGITITDQGPGVSKEQMQHIFQPFTKADGQDALQMDHGGLGINLYLDKMIMEYLGGGIKVDSQAEKGTTVSLQWPHIDGSTPSLIASAKPTVHAA